MNALGIQRLLLVLLGIWLTTSGGLAAQQLSPDEQAAQLLDAGRRAFNEGNQPFAAEKFRQYLKQYAGNKDAHQARLGLGIALKVRIRWEGGLIERLWWVDGLSAGQTNSTTARRHQN